MESSYFLKKISGTGKLIVSLIIIILSIFFEYLIINNYNKEKSSVKPYEEAKGYNEYVYVDVTSFTDYFATHTVEDTTKYFYFVSDGKYLYIANLKPSDYLKLPRRIYGYTSTISSDLARIAKDSYNEYAGSNEITDENLYSMFGNYYIDATKTPLDDLIGFTIVNGIFFLVGIIILIVYLVNSSKNKKELLKYNKEKIIKDIDKKDTITSHKGKLYLTEKYILSYKSKIDIINYEDVVWIYPHMEKYRGITTGSIMVMDTKGKNHAICYIQLNEKTNIEFDEIYVDLRNKLPHSLYGYTAENKEKAYDVVNRYKGKQ